MYFWTTCCIFAEKIENMKKSIIYILLAITFILAVAAIVPWVFIGYGVYKVADTSEKVSDAIEKALDTPSEGLSKNNMTESDNEPTYLSLWTSSAIIIISFVW